MCLLTLPTERMVDAAEALPILAGFTSLEPRLTRLVSAPIDHFSVRDRVLMRC